MDFITKMDLLSKFLVGVMTFGAMVFGFLRWVRPLARQVFRDLNSARDSIVGRDAVHDSITGKEIAPALPGIGVRMATTEQQMTVLTEAVAKIADSSARLDEHDARLKHLEEAAVERVVARAESTAAWRAVEAVASTPPTHDPQLPFDTVRDQN